MEENKVQARIPSQGEKIQLGSNITVERQPAQQPIPQQPTQQVINEQIRQKMTQLLGEILGKAQEVGFELATLDCPHANNCPLVKKSRELIVTLKKLFELRRELEKT
ncbi:MAG: hypothetical protein DRP01_03235 [Archaeoglobales archaeon]|nr:MAG: hypothetical protein DRP01_03235 [Archaeoglobales archaeon]